MNFRHAPWLAGALVLTGALQAAPAQAQVGFGPLAWQYFGNGFSANNLDYLPYYAAHPPVYYSRPVPRTYGYSPWAYPPGVMTPDVKWVAPEVVLNPFFTVPQATAPRSTSASSPPSPGAEASTDTPPASQVTQEEPAPRPLRLENPFYRSRQLSDAR